MTNARLAKAVADVLKLTPRVELLGGQRYKYVKLEDVLTILGVEWTTDDAPSPVPHPGTKPGGEFGSPANAKYGERWAEPVPPSDKDTTDDA